MAATEAVTPVLSSAKPLRCLARPCPEAAHVASAGPPAGPPACLPVCPAADRRAFQDTARQYMVRVSYMEIYNEKVRDLLNPEMAGEELKVRTGGPEGTLASAHAESYGHVISAHISRVSVAKAV